MTAPSPPSTEAPGPPPGAETPASSPGRLASELTGDLPCVVCRYNLRGLSVRASCPECGAPVGVTILARVDPHAAELAPVHRPRLTSLALIACPAAAFAAAVCVWVLRGGDFIDYILETEIVGQGALKKLSLALIAIAGLCSLALVRPTTDIPRRRSVVALVCSLLFGVVIAIQYRMHFLLESILGRAYPPEVLNVERPALHLAATACLAFIVVGLRRNWRVFIARSRLMRSGRVDRQELNPLVIVLLVVIVGDAGMIASGVIGDTDLARTVSWLSMFLVGIGSLLFTVGLLTLTTDAWRLRPFIRRGAIAPEDVLGRRETPPEPRDG